MGEAAPLWAHGSRRPGTPLAQCRVRLVGAERPFFSIPPILGFLAQLNFALIKGQLLGDIEITFMR
jgi:hypothetical protein